MYNGEYEFDNMLTDMEREVLELKTAHQRPLGALNFFSAEDTFTINLNYSYGIYYREFYIIVKIATPVTTPPIVQTGWNTPPNFFLTELIETSISADYTTWTYKLDLLSENQSSANFKVGVKSSQPIISITRTYA